MKPHNLLIGVVLFVLCVAGVDSYRQAQAQDYKAKLDWAKSVCDESRQDPTTASYQKCGEAQDATHTEYLCNNVGGCWLEVK
jgi:hypothetical protein